MSSVPEASLLFICSYRTNVIPGYTAPGHLSLEIKPWTYPFMFLHFKLAIIIQITTWQFSNGKVWWFYHLVCLRKLNAKTKYEWNKYLTSETLFIYSFVHSHRGQNMNQDISNKIIRLTVADKPSNVRSKSPLTKYVYELSEG